MINDEMPEPTDEEPSAAYTSCHTRLVTGIRGAQVHLGPWLMDLWLTKAERIPAAKK